MKPQKSYVFLACILICFGAKAVTPEEPPYRTIKVVNVEKVDGRRSFFGIFGEVKYNKIECKSSVAYVTNPVTGRPVEIITTNYTCEGPGGESCRHSGDAATVESARDVTSGVYAFMDTIVNSLLDLIDKLILEKEEYQGSIYETYRRESPGGNAPTYFSAHAVWRDGNENGDAKISIRVSDVTDEMSGLLYY